LTLLCSLKIILRKFERFCRNPPDFTGKLSGIIDGLQSPLLAAGARFDGVTKLQEFQCRSPIKEFTGRDVRILWVKAGKLLPVDTGGKIRSYNILKHLARNHVVTVLSYYGGPRDSKYESAIAEEFPAAHTMHTGALDGSFLVQLMDYFTRMFQAAPFAVSKFTDHAVQGKLASWLRGDDFDVAVCDFLSASQNFPHNPAVPCVLFQHNVETALWARLAGTESNLARRLAYKMEARKMQRYETAALRRFPHVIAVSDHDREQMLQMNPACQITVVPTGVDTRAFVVAEHRETNSPKIVFTGSMDWEPNIDAVSYFCREVFPAIREEFPSAIFQIVGRKPHAKVKRLASDSVQVTGTVPSVADYLREATVVVVPLRIGGGTRLKIFEAMAMGKALVSTSIGAEGLDVRSGRDLLLADDARSFIDSILLLLRDGELRRKYELAAVKVASQHDWSRITERFTSVLQAAVRDSHNSSGAMSIRLRQT
jgi:polysaccharide biosynthesis protein PslH